MHRRALDAPDGASGGHTRPTFQGDDDRALGADLVERDFTAQQPNQLKVADLTHVATWQGFVYVAFVIDAFSRMIVGWRWMHCALIRRWQLPSRSQRLPVGTIRAPAFTARRKHYHQRRRKAKKNA